MAFVATLTFEQARATVIERSVPGAAARKIETVALRDADGRVLASPVRADRDYPPLARSLRDGFAVRSEDVPGVLEITGEVRAGQAAADPVRPGCAIEIMTGAPVPEGAGAIVMVEHVERDGGRVRVSLEAPAGQFINPRGAEARQGDCLIEAGRRIGFAEIAMLATVGCSEVPVYRRPSVAIIATGDEILEIDETPAPHQIRNSNAWSLASQVRRAGGEPKILPVARDTAKATAELTGRGLESDLLLLSGGVSAGKYDLVETVLAAAGAEFFFDRVLIQPGQPLVFGSALGTLFFGLPGNPASTMVTFEIFARAALELLGGQRESMLPFTLATLETDFRHKPGLTRFLPARLSGNATVRPVPWQGSSDVAALARANSFLVADSNRESWAAGDPIRVLLK